jgi:hypothetical protein
LYCTPGFPFSTTCTHVKSTANRYLSHAEAVQVAAAGLAPPANHSSALPVRARGIPPAHHCTTITNLQNYGTVVHLYHRVPNSLSAQWPTFCTIKSPIAHLPNGPTKIGLDQAQCRPLYHQQSSHTHCSSGCQGWSCAVQAQYNCLYQQQSSHEHLRTHRAKMYRDSTTLGLQST